MEKDEAWNPCDAAEFGAGQVTQVMCLSWTSSQAQWTLNTSEAGIMVLLVAEWQLLT